MAQLPCIGFTKSLYKHLPFEDCAMYSCTLTTFESMMFPDSPQTLAAGYPGYVKLVASEASIWASL